MLLKRDERRFRPWRPLALLQAVSLTPLLISACALRYDDSYARPQHDGQTTATACEAEQQRRLPFGLRLDDAPAVERAARAERMGGDPRLTPTPRERREARAMALAQVEVLKTGGSISYRGDGSSSSPDNVRFVSSPGALTIDYSATNMLNAVEGTPHALTVVIYHLTDRVALDQRSRSEEGLRRLLDGEVFDDAVVGVRRITLQPSSKGQLVIDRPENGRFVALVAGYHGLQTPASLYVTNYHLGRWMAEGNSIISKDRWMYSSLPLNLRVNLGEDGMQVTDTGLIYDSMRDVTTLTWRQTNHELVKKFVADSP